MPNYQNSIIYKIYGKNHDMVYYGSTTRELRFRKSEHLSSLNKKKFCHSKKIIQTKDFIFEIVEKFPCNNRKELNEREKYFIKNFDCINKLGNGQTKKEYYENNKEKIKKKSKDYYHKNKIKILQNQKNKKKYLCVCGSLIQHNKAIHERTKKHVMILEKKI